MQPGEPAAVGPASSGERGEPAPIRLAEALRVGLATDLQEVSLPCCERDVTVESEAGVVATTTTVRIQPAAEVLQPGFFRLQVAALKDEVQARGLAERLRKITSQQADVVFDAGTDLYRVRVGRYPTREAAEQDRARLVSLGMGQPWVVGERGVLGKARFRVIQGEHSELVSGRWLTVRGGKGEGIRVREGRYRGRILIYLNDRGSLNLINEVALEDYLRGVVPREMGPAVYDQLEALKAQAVAARTYTARNLGEFRDEGYDICATPRCQVYSGIEVEHELTDRAIAETAHQVLVYEGELVDALYSSTCGGHTENVQVVFPLKSAPYLKGVACLEAGVDRLAGDLDRGEVFPSGLTQRLLPASDQGSSASAVGARFRELAQLAGLPIPEDRLASLERREVQRFIASLFDLALDARLFVAREDLPYLLEHPPAGWSESDLRLAAYLTKSGLLVGDLAEPLSAAELEETLFRLAVYLRVLEHVEGRYQAIENGQLVLRKGQEMAVYTMGDRLATFRRRGDHLVSSPLVLLPGDRIGVYLDGDVLMAVTHEADTDGAAFDRSSNYSSWNRFRSDAQLAELVNARYPGTGFRTLSVLSRGVSGRVGKIRLEGDDGAAVEIEGLAVRWTLDLPDTLFTAKRLDPPQGESGWLFTGRGWGHGVGLCQVGAYGMALRGHDYRDILEHYYTGVEVATAETVQRGQDAVSP